MQNRYIDKLIYKRYSDFQIGNTIYIYIYI